MKLRKSTKSTKTNGGRRSKAAKRKTRRRRGQKKGNKKPEDESPDQSKGANPNAKGIVKPMSCSPIVKGKTITENSCYTADALSKIKEAYNKNHGQEDQILDTDPKMIYESLRSRLTHCGSEDCWLEQIKDSKVRQQLDQILFAPDQPPEWKDNPTEWLSNFDIEKVLQQYEIAYPQFKLLGPSSIDYDTIVDGGCVWDDICRMQLKDLMARKKRKLGIVFNLDKHDEPGSHWVSMFVDLDNKFIFYFDSALNPTPPEIVRLKKTIMKQGLALNPPIKFKYITNTKAHQKTNTECGMYTLYFIISLLTGKPPEDKEKTARQGGNGQEKDPNRNKNDESMGGNVNLIQTFVNGSLSDKNMVDLRDDLYTEP